MIRLARSLLPTSSSPQALRLAASFQKRAMSSAASYSGPDICLDEFTYRQFDDDTYAGTKICGISKEDFMQSVLDFYEPKKAVEKEFQSQPVLVDGYAPFCKHIFMPCSLPISSPVAEITAENEHLLRTRYEARSEKELPVLSRYFPEASITAPAASWLDLILYSRDQIVLENAATGKRSGELAAAPWRLISIKAQGVPHELPMQPITVMRNALISEGGSGVDIDRKAYQASVDYWSKHATIAK